MDTNSLENTSDIFQIIPQGYSSIKEYITIENVHIVQIREAEIV